jgi:hypothetical protein
VQYQPRPLDISKITLPAEITALTERLAENSHDFWASQRLQDGWTLGPARDDGPKQHPSLVPYDELPDAEKVYDRRLALETPRAILALAYKFETVG